MKKLFTCLMFITLIGSFASAEMYVEEKTTQDIRIEVDLTAFVNDNVAILGAGLDGGLKISTYNNKVGFMLGCRGVTDMIFDPLCGTVNVIPFICVELWGVDIIGGFFPQIDNFTDNNTFMLGLNYNFNVIEPDYEKLSSSMSIRVGASWYPSMSNIGFDYSYNPENKDIEGALLGAGIWSIIIPRLEVGVTYRLGKSFTL